MQFQFSNLQPELHQEKKNLSIAIQDAKNVKQERKKNILKSIKVSLI